MNNTNTGTDNDVDIPNLSDRERAVMSYTAGKGYVEACKMLYLSEHRYGRAEMLVPPMGNLIGFGIEFYLKSYLQIKGLPEEKVEAFGHNIKGLNAEAQKNGLPPNTSFTSLLRIVGPLHKGLKYRYLKRHYKYKPIEWQSAFEATDWLDVFVDTEIGASAEFGMQPGH